MPKKLWKKGESGNPKGRPKKGNAWADILGSVGEEVHEKYGKTYKEIVARRAWADAINGNWTAIIQLFNRIDGLPVSRNQMLDSEGDPTDSIINVMTYAKSDPLRVLSRKVKPASDPRFKTSSKISSTELAPEGSENNTSDK